VASPLGRSKSSRILHTQSARQLTTPLNWVLDVSVDTINWDSVGALAELVGAIATLAMLVYLTMQLRQNTKAIQSSSFHAANVALSENFAKTPSEALSKYKDWEECDEGEKLAQLESMARHFTMYETMYYLNRDGTLNSELWESRSEHILLMLEYANGQVFWKERRHWFARSFRDYVDNLIIENVDDA
jgi:hypothetical protein